MRRPRGYIGAMPRSGDFDPACQFVRVREPRPDGRVEFDSAVGEPRMFVAMRMPAAAFDDFRAGR